MGAAVYILSTLVTAVCTVLLLRGYASRRKRLLLWSGLCFAIFTASNVLVFVDLVLLPQVDLFRYRLASVAVAMAILLYGLIWESDR